LDQPHEASDDGEWVFLIGIKPKSLTKSLSVARRNIILQRNMSGPRTLDGVRCVI
jgi:hypothetical protein